MSSARAQLSHAIEDYLATCKLLASTCVVTQPRSSDRHSHELVLSALSTELSTLKQEEDRVQKSKIILIGARNKAKMTAPIYSLPAETLTRIFLEAACHYAHDESKHPTYLPLNPVTLSAVCKLWRNVAINFRSLWAHLDILIGGKNRQPRYPSSQLWISRLQQTPLHIHIRLYSPLRRRPGKADHSRHLNDVSDSDGSGSSGRSDDSDHSEVSSDFDDSDDSGTSGGMQYPVARTAPSLSSLIDFLAPLMPHADSLELISSLPCQHLLYSFTNRLLGPSDKPVQMKAVRIIQDGERNPLRFKTSLPLAKFNSKAYKAFFSSLLTLDLRNVYPLWDHLTLTNLVELRFEALSLKHRVSVTEAGLAATLASCSKLRSLMLYNLRVTQAPVGATVTLNDLRVLSLRCMAWNGELKRVISMIHPGLHPLHLSVHLPEKHESNTKLLAELYAFSFHTWFASQLGPLPNVQTLVLKGCHISDITMSRASRYVNPSPIDPSLILWPQLQGTHLRQLLSPHSIQTLYLHLCYDDLYSDIRFLTPQSREECRLLLSDFIPNIKILENDAHDETRDWPF
ncbi:hypothetical protein FRC10_010955, partial [Ceratobasidium sp. 414]